MWFDSHCHLDAAEFDPDRDAVVAAARAAGVSGFLNLPGHVDHFDAALASRTRYGTSVGLGIHPMWVKGPLGHSARADLDRLVDAVQAARPDVIGEIGLDFFIDGFDQAEQEWFYVEQLKVARRFDLPVVLHVRKSQDRLLKYLRQVPVPGGFAHAFNGSPEQAQAFVDLGFKLGFGGAATFPGARRIRHLLATLPETAIVVETDSPDIAPVFLGPQRLKARNSPIHLPQIGALLAEVRGMKASEFAALTTANVLAILPQARR